MKKASEVNVFKEAAVESAEAAAVETAEETAKAPEEKKPKARASRSKKAAAAAEAPEEKVEEAAAEPEAEEEVLAEAEESPVEVTEDGEAVAEQPKEQPVRRSGRILTAERGGTTGGGALRREAEMYHFYEAAKFNRDQMRRPVFYGRLVSFKRQTVEGKTMDFALVEHTPMQLPEPAIIYIPASEIVLNEGRRRDADMSFAINAMIGAMVEFIITGVVREFGMIIGSRKIAMQKLQETYYGGDNPQIYENRKVEARVMSVTPRRMTLDVFGVETVVTRVEDFRWDFAESFTSKYEVGDKVLVRVLGVGEKNGERTVEVTGRMEEESPDASNLRFLTRGSTQLGKVTRYYNGIYFVRLSIGVNAVVHVVQGNSVCSVGDMVKVRVTDVDRRRCQAKGTIVSVFR